MATDRSPQGPADPGSVPFTNEAARDIYQGCLDRIDVPFWNRLWDMVGPCFEMPHRLSSPDSDRVVEDAAEFLTLLQAARDNFEAVGATSYHRICKSARFEADDRVIGTHESFILRGGTPIIGRYMGRATFCLREGTWRSVSLYAEKRETTLPLFHADTIRLNRP